MFGIEKRKGHKRLQGFYGAEIGLSFQSQSENYKYGNTLTSTSNIAFNTTNFGNNIDFSTNPDGYTMRKLDSKNGTGISVNLGLFFGAEFFITKQFSVAGEFTWYVVYNTVGKGSVKYEYWNTSDNKIEEYKETTLGGSSLFMDSTPSGMLTFNLYF